MHLPRQNVNFCTKQFINQINRPVNVFLPLNRNIKLLFKLCIFVMRVHVYNVCGLNIMYHFIKHSAHTVTKDCGFSCKQFLSFLLLQITQAVISSSSTLCLQPLQDLFFCSNPCRPFFNLASFINCRFCFCCCNC